MAEAFASVTSSPHAVDEYAYIPEFQELEPEECDSQTFEPRVSQKPVYAYAAKRDTEDQSKEKAISSTGSFRLKIGSHEVLAMVDSGAEMNMITPTLAESLWDYFAEDETGKKFQMCNVSGVVSHLKGRFNDIPVFIGGHCLHGTFFVGDEWNSHFNVILGQAFLQSHACEMSWEEGNHIHMWLYPTRNKNEDAIMVWLLKRKDLLIPAHVGVAEFYESNGPGSEDEDHGSPSHNQHTTPHPSYPSDEPEYYASDSSDQPRRRSSLSGSDYTSSSSMEAEGEYDWYNLNQPDTPEAHVSQIAPRKD
jgi:hypothetical protein